MRLNIYYQYYRSLFVAHWVNVTGNVSCNFGLQVVPTSATIEREFHVSQVQSLCFTGDVADTVHCSSGLRSRG